MSRVLKIGYSVEHKAFMAKYLPVSDTHTAMNRYMRYLGTTQVEYNEQYNVWFIHTSMINAIKLKEAVSKVAIANKYEVVYSQSFNVKVEMLKQGLDKGKKQLGTVSPDAVKLRHKPVDSDMDDLLMPFQKEGYEFIVQNNGRALLADDMGLGKTIQSLAFIKTYSNIKKCIILCPKTAKDVWTKEIEKWDIPGVCFTIDGSPNVYDMTDGFLDTRFIILNYDILGSQDNRGKWQKWIPYLKEWKADCLICDEIHYIKNRKAARTKATEYLAHGIKFVLGLTGTPVQNSPMEIYTIANMIRPNMFAYTDFNYRFCGMEGMKCRSAHNAQELHHLLTSTIMKRRLKKDVLKQLPAKQLIQVELEIDTAKYDKILKDWATEIFEQKGEVHHLSYMAKLRECIARDKIPPLLEWCDRFLEDTDRKLVIMAHHKIIRDMLYKHFESCAVKIEGGMNSDSRNAAVNDFQNNDKIRVFIGSITACAESITLTASSDICMAEMIYNPKKMEQAEDRVHRYGQSKQVTVWNLVCMGTMEEDILDILVEKRKMAAQVIDGATVEEALLSVEQEVKYRLLDMLDQKIYGTSKQETV